MATLYTGGQDLPFGLMPSGQSPLDQRLVVATKADLIAANTYASKNYYAGMPVVVKNDGTGKAQLWVLIDPTKVTAADYSGWQRLDADSVGIGNDIQDAIDDLVNGASTSANTLKKLEDLIGAEKTAREGAINDLDFDKTLAAHQFATHVKQENGKIVEFTGAQPTAEDVSATAIAAGTDTVAVAGTTVKAQIADLAKSIKGEQQRADSAEKTIVGESTDTADDLTLNGLKKAIEGASSDSTQAIEDAKEELIGTASSASSTDTIKGAKKYTDEKIAGLDSEKNATAGKYITGVKITDGKLESVAEKQVAASEVAFTPAGTIAATTVQAAIAEVSTDAKVTMTESAGTGNIAKVYTFSQNGVELGKINIATDLVVKKGTVVKGTWANDVFTENATAASAPGNKALKLEFTGTGIDPVYINVLDLVKDHTAGNGITISDTNQVSVKLDPSTESYLTVGAAGIKLAGVKKAIDDAVAGLKSTADNYTINSQKISTNPVLAGNDLKITDAASYAKATSQAAVAKDDTITVAVGKVEKKADDLITTVNKGYTEVASDSTKVTLTAPNATTGAAGTVKVEVTVIDGGTY